MKKFKNLTSSWVKILFLIFAFTCITMQLKSQMPAAITIEPPDATAYDEITLIFDPELACFQSGSLAGLPSIAMHSGVTLISGQTWQFVIEFNSTGVNGQATTLMPTGDGRFSITYTPSWFYGFPFGTVVTQICAVFNNGTNWDQDGRDFDPGNEMCMDFFIPINSGLPHLTEIEPQEGIQGDSLSVIISGLNTHFLNASTDLWLSKDSETLEFDSFYALSDTLISAQLIIPEDAMAGLWDVYVENPEDGLLTLSEAFYISYSTNVMPAAITIEPPDATAYDEMTLIFDPEESCFQNGSLAGLPYIAMQSGVTLSNGQTYQYFVAFDETGANGQSPILEPTGDGRFAITYIPYQFYGFTGEIVTQICAVFNNGNDWSQEGFDFLPNSPYCISFYIPINSDSIVPYLTGIDPDEAELGQSLEIMIYGSNTHFQNASTTIWLSKGAEEINFDSFIAENDTVITAQLSIPEDALAGHWDVYMENPEDGLKTLQDAFLINNLPVVIPAAITIEPPLATAYDELTLIFDPAEACFINGSLAGLPSVAIHSGVTLITGETWQYLVEFNGTGVNGQATTLEPTGDDRYSLTYTPSEFYGLNGEVVTQICAIFNNGTNWEQDGYDYIPDTQDCMDFFIPINTGVDPILTGIEPETGEAGETLTVIISGSNTHFLYENTQVWLSNEFVTLDFYQVGILNDSVIGALLSIPEYLIGYWDVNIENDLDGMLTLFDAFLISNSNIVLPAAISIDPPDATAYDELTLIFDPEEACFWSGSLAGLPSIAMHSGVSFMNGSIWNLIVEFNGVGANGQSPILQPTGDDRFEITFTPSEFYGLTDEIVPYICAVFNNGTNWNQDGRDFIPGSYDCMDFFIPLNYPITGTDENKITRSDLKVYPNPASDNIHIHSKTMLKRIYIFNLLGEVVIDLPAIKSKELTVRIEDFVNGIYIIKCYDHDGGVMIAKFIKN